MPLGPPRNFLFFYSLVIPDSVVKTLDVCRMVQDSNMGHMVRQVWEGFVMTSTQQGTADSDQNDIPSVAAATGAVWTFDSKA